MLQAFLSRADKFVRDFACDILSILFSWPAYSSQGAYPSLSVWLSATTTRGRLPHKRPWAYTAVSYPPCAIVLPRAAPQKRYRQCSHTLPVHPASCPTPIPPKKTSCISQHTCGPAIAESCIVDYHVPHEMMRSGSKHGIISLLRTRSHYRLL